MLLASSAMTSLHYVICFMFAHRTLSSSWLMRTWEFVPFPLLSACMSCQLPQFVFQLSRSVVASTGSPYWRRQAFLLPAVNRDYQTTRKTSRSGCNGLLEFVNSLGFFFSGNKCGPVLSDFALVFTQSVKPGSTAWFLQHSRGSWDIPFSCIFNNF